MVSLKSIFGAKSPREVTLEDINDAIGNIRIQRKLGNITKEESKKILKKLSEFENKKIDAVKKSKAWEEKMKAQVEKRSKRAEELANLKPVKEIGVFPHFKVKGVKSFAQEHNITEKFRKATYTVTFIAIARDANGKYMTHNVSEDVSYTKGSSAYQMCMEAWEQYIHRKYRSVSPFEPEQIKNVKFILKKKAVLKKVSMKQQSLLYKMFNELDRPDMVKGECVLDYLVNEAQRLEARKPHWTRSYLRFKLGSSPNTEQLMKFCMAEKNVNMYALDMCFTVFALVKAVEPPRVSLTFVCNNGHLYPITDTLQKKQIAAINKLKLEDLKHLSYDDMENVEVVEPVYKDDAFISCSQTCEKIQKASGKHIILKDVDNLTAFAGTMMKQKNTAFERFHFYDHEMTMFEDSTTGQIIIAGDDYDERKAVCDSFYSRYKISDYKFTNQSWACISMGIHDNVFGMIPKSHYSDELKEIFAKHPVMPYRIQFEDVKRIKKDSDIYSIDITKAYTSFLLNNDFPYAVTSSFDAVRPCVIETADDIKPGYYYIENDFVMEHYIVEFRGWKPAVLVKFAIEQGYIKSSEVSYALESRGSLPADTFKPFVEFILKEFPKKSKGDNIAKSLINMFVGCLGSVYSRTETAGVTNDLLTALATLQEHCHKKATLDPVKDLYIVRVVEEIMKDHGNMPIYQHIIAMGRIALAKMTKAIVIPDTVVYSYNTDAIKVGGKINWETVVEKTLDTEPGKWCLEESKKISGLSCSELERLYRPKEYEHKQVEINRTVDASVDRTKNSLTIGEAGSGKTEMIKRIYQESDTVVSFQNKACKNLRKRGVEAKTFDSMFMNQKTKYPEIERFKDVKFLMVDEAYQLPPLYLQTIMRASEKYGFKVAYFGDWRQGKSVATDWIRLDTNPVFLKHINGNINELTYKMTRYDEAMYKTLKDFVATGKLAWKAMGNIKSYRNICKTNNIRKKVNKDCFERWIAEHDAEVVHVSGNSNQLKQVAVGLPVMAYHNNILDLEIYKTDEFIIKTIDDKFVELERDSGEIVSLKMSEFLDVFDYTFCVTMYKIQGDQFNVHYNILEARQMSRNELYTAISRGYSLDKVHIDGIKEFYYSDMERHHTYKRLLPEFTVGRIYQIQFENGDDYIGSTVQTIEERLEGHRTHPTSDVMSKALATQKHSIALLEEFKFKETDDLLRVEMYYIHSHPSKGKRLNGTYNKPSKVTVAETKTKDVKPRKSKFNIFDDVKEKRFRIKIMIEGKTQTFRFPYSSMPKEEAYALAEAKQKELRANY